MRNGGGGKPAIMIFLGLVLIIVAAVIGSATWVIVRSAVTGSVDGVDDSWREA